MRAAVGFDLDMTLIDSRRGIAAAYRALTAKTGVYVDADLAVTRLGPPLRAELRRWFPAPEVERAVTTYRALYPDHAIGPTRLPGICSRRVRRPRSSSTAPTGTSVTTPRT
jgi:phosphoglycolate phosphatase